MSDWGWVGFAYAVVYGALGAYVASLVIRARRVRRSLARR